MIKRKSPPDDFLTRLPDFQRNCHGNRDAYPCYAKFLDMVFKSVYCNADFVSPVFMRTQILMQRKRGKLFFSGAVPMGLYIKKDRGCFTSLKKIICAFFLTESTIRFKMGCLGFTQRIVLFD